MARYIDAERMPNDSFWEGLTDKEKAKVLQWLLQSPTAEVEEVKHGEWIKRQKLYGIGSEYVCSVCEKGIRHYEGQPICSECGAKMDGDV